LANTFTDQYAITITREVNAPRERVWQAFTDPEQVAQWWGPSRYQTRVEKHEFRIGGEWRYVHVDPQGNEYSFHGVYKHIRAPLALERTFVYEGIPEADSHALAEAVVLTTLSDGRTHIGVETHYNNIEELEGMVASGMESGATESLERLAKLVEEE
jgi:uncharacterized protein YndB with AHSA1/START domain